MPPVSDFFQWGGWIIGLLSGSIVIYKYFLKRPSLCLKIKTRGTIDEENNIPLRLLVVNNGRRYGEDVMVNMTLEGMNFIDINKEQNISDTESPSEIMFGKYAEYNEIRPPPGTNLVPGGESLFEFDRKKAVRTNQVMFQLEDVIYSKLGVQFTTRLTEFLEDSATITYHIACRSHEPRKGVIELELNGDEVIISSIEPTLQRRIRRRLAQISP